jgi:hypothetical protein
MKETKLQRDIRLLRAQVARLEMQRNGALAALVNAETKLPGLRKTLDRLRLRLASKLDRRPAPHAGKVQDALPVPAAHVPEDRRPADNTLVIEDDTSAEPLAGQPDELEIPAYLKRTPLDRNVAEAAHAVANAHNKPPTPEQKKLVAAEKRKVKEEHKQAELTGKKRKWPATGHAAQALTK